MRHADTTHTSSCKYQSIYTIIYTTNGFGGHVSACCVLSPANSMYAWILQYELVCIYMHMHISLFTMHTSYYSYSSSSSSSKYAYAYYSNMHIGHNQIKHTPLEQMMLCSTSLVCIFILIILCIHRTCLLLTILCIVYVVQTCYQNEYYQRRTTSTSKYNMIYISCVHRV